MERWISWTEKFLAKEPKNIRPLTDDESRMLLTLSTVHIQEKHKKTQTPLNLDGIFAARVLKKRAEYYKLGIDDYTIAFLSFVSENPATLVMWCHALKAWQMMTKRPVEWEIFIATHIPLGIPTSEFLEEMWDLQKEGSANFLDMVSLENIEAVFEECQS